MAKWAFFLCRHWRFDGVISALMSTWHGIIQGSVLGPILYAIFISPIFDVENLLRYILYNICIWNTNVNLTTCSAFSLMLLMQLWNSKKTSLKKLKLCIKNKKTLIFYLFFTTEIHQAHVSHFSFPTSFHWKRVSQRVR